MPRYAARMEFQDALIAMKRGARVRRAYWTTHVKGGEQAFIYIADPMLKVGLTDQEARERGMPSALACGQFIAVHGNAGMVAPYTIPPMDLFADDWEISS